jgi:hypothetical protein
VIFTRTTGDAAAEPVRCQHCRAAAQTLTLTSVVFLRGADKQCIDGAECLSTSRIFYQEGENIQIGFSTIGSAPEDAIIIESVGSSDGCLATRYTDGRPFQSTTLKDTNNALSGVVEFDAATTPLPPGEYVVRLATKSATAQMASTHFVVAETFGA